MKPFRIFLRPRFFGHDQQPLDARQFAGEYVMRILVRARHRAAVTLGPRVQAVSRLHRDEHASDTTGNAHDGQQAPRNGRIHGDVSIP
jgi:hypothetical protein